MKELHIMRHGKSSWDYPGIDDLDRPLIEKGIKNTISSSHYLQKEFGIPSIIISSPAIRALHTALIMARICGVSYNNLKIDERIYDGFSSSIIDVVEEIRSDYDSIVIVGHNPVLTEFCNLFLPDYLENLPTAGIVSLTFDIIKWEIVDKQPISSKVYFPKKDL